MAPSSSNLAAHRSVRLRVQGVSLYGNLCGKQRLFRFTGNLPCKREKARTRVLNLLETPERAATLACSESITSLLLARVNTKKPLRQRRFSGGNASESANKRHANVRRLA